MVGGAVVAVVLVELVDTREGKCTQNVLFVYLGHERTGEGT